MIHMMTLLLSLSTLLFVRPAIAKEVGQVEQINQMLPGGISYQADGTFIFSSAYEALPSKNDIKFRDKKTRETVVKIQKNEAGTISHISSKAYGYGSYLALDSGGVKTKTKCRKNEGSWLKPLMPATECITVSSNVCSRISANFKAMTLKEAKEKIDSCSDLTFGLKGISVSLLDEEVANITKINQDIYEGKSIFGNTASVTRSLVTSSKTAFDAEIAMMKYLKEAMDVCEGVTSPDVRVPVKLEKANGVQ